MKSIRERRRSFSHILSPLASFVTLSLRLIFASSEYTSIILNINLHGKVIRTTMIVSNDQEIIIRKKFDTSLPHGPCFTSVESKMKKKEVAGGENTSEIGCRPKNAGKSSCNTIRRYETRVRLHFAENKAQCFAVF